MVKRKTPLRVNIRQDRNSASRTYGMWFPFVDSPGTLSTRALCEHIASHGSIWTEDIVAGILAQLKECIPELVAQGYGVKLDGLGIFWPTVENKKGGAESGVDYNPDSEIEGVHIRFQPDNTDLDKLSLKAFKEYCSLEQGYAVKPYDVTVEGKKKLRHVKLPMAEWLAGADFPSTVPDNTDGGGVEP